MHLAPSVCHFMIMSESPLASELTFELVLDILSTGQTYLCIQLLAALCAGLQLAMLYARWPSHWPTVLISFMQLCLEQTDTCTCQHPCLQMAGTSNSQILSAAQRNCSNSAQSISHFDLYSFPAWHNCITHLLWPICQLYGVSGLVIR